MGGGEEEEEEVREEEGSVVSVVLVCLYLACRSVICQNISITESQTDRLQVRHTLHPHHPLPCSLITGLNQ